MIHNAITNTLSLIIAFAIAIGAAVAVDRYVYRDFPDYPEKRLNYHQRFAAMRLNKYEWKRAKTYTSLEHCNKSGRPDDLSLDHSKIRATGAFRLCLFYLFEKLGNPEKSKQWFLSGGFEVNGPRINSSTKIVTVTGSWDSKSKGRMYSNSIFFKNIAYLEKISTEWASGDALMRVETWAYSK